MSFYCCQNNYNHNAKPCMSVHLPQGKTVVLQGALILTN